MSGKDALLRAGSGGPLVVGEGSPSSFVTWRSVWLFSDNGAAVSEAAAELGESRWRWSLTAAESQSAALSAVGPALADCLSLLRGR